MPRLSSSAASTAGLPDGSTIVGVPIVLRGSRARGASSRSALTATPGHPLVRAVRCWLCKSAMPINGRRTIRSAMRR
jgi:hypothetical protein